ncbi:uncharacterized protein TA09555 [Theileria annulata]|uniref:HECT domain-containing protein n=1 Tax=Theileria annulata TaxID=5874 RepID=Q4UJ22_THEAN|nr:uncharacterized protein TA09555 [Theileria annulata]CAI72917.1 hypothetical protein, conserved [Theileria annulata]|eukprot:XP_953595.1 hypothetical protein, conserved [Theileria annulata]
MIEELIKKTLGVKFMNLEFNVKMFGTCDKSFHTSSRIPSVRRHFMRRSHFYKLIEHDVFDMLQGLVHVFRDYFYRKILDQCKDTMILFRSSIIHFSTTFDSNSLEYYELVDSNTGGNGVEEISKMNLFSAACDPLYSWQLLFYDPFKKEETGRNELVKVLFTEIIYCMVVSMSSIRYLKLLECVFWILDTLPKHPLCPCNLRLALTNKFTLSLLNFLFLNGTGSPPKLSQVSARITHKVIPSLSVWELEQLLELIMYLGTCAFMRVHSVCNYYSTSDLDMFTNFDHKRHDHTTRLTTANILHSFLTSFVLACEWVDNNFKVSDVAIIRILEYSDFYNMGVYLYLARNKKLNKQMLSHFLSLTPEIYTSMPLKVGKLVKDSDKVGEIGDFGSFSTFSAKNFPSRKNSTMLKTSPILNQTDRNPQVHFISCSDRYHGLILKFKVELPTRFVFSQYKDFSKVLAELIVSPPKTQELKLGQFYPLEEYVNNVPLIKYKLELDPKYIYTIGYTIETFDNINNLFGEKIFDEQPFNQQQFNQQQFDEIFKNEKMVYKLINGTCVEMYMTNNYIFWNIDSNTTSTYFKHQVDLIPFIIVNSRLDGEVAKCIIKLDSFVIIPVTNCYVKKHVNEFGLLNLGNGFVVRPAIRTGLSVHKTKVSFSGVTQLDLSTSALVKLNDKINLTLNPCLEEVMRYDPCLPFRLSFKFEKGFNVNVRPDFYIGLVSDREKLLWFSNGDLYISTNFHVPSKDNEYRKINCLPFYETDVISVSFNPQESSLYFTVTNQTVKLDFHSYYYHITSVYTDNIIASTNTNTNTEDTGTNTRALSTTNTNPIPTNKSTLSTDNSDSGSDYGYTCADRRNLINAVIFDDLAKIKSFLEFPCELFENGCDDHFDVDGHDYFLYSPIYIACNLGKLSLLKLMALNKNINFDVKSGPYKSTPLMGAVQGGHYDVVYHLLTIHSIDINAVDSSGHKCLYYSLFRSKEINFKIVELLLNFGADVHSDGTGSISENLHSIPGNNNLHKKLIDNHKLQKGVFYKSNWSLLQNLHIFMSNKLYVKYNIKVDPSVLGPISTLPQTATPVTAGMSSPEFLSPDRRIESPDDTDILELMGNFLGKLTEDVKEGINTTMDLLTEGLQHLHSSKTDFSTKNSGFSALNSGISLNSIKNMTSLKNTTSIRSFNSKTSINNTLGTMGTIGSSLNTMSSSNIKVVLNNIINEDTVQMSNLVMKYVEESLEIIRKTLYKMKTGLDETNPLMKSVWNELNLTLKEFIIYHLCKFIKAIESETDELLKNFIALANSFINQLSECEGLSIVSETQYIILKFIRFENQLVSFGIANNELLFTQRLRRNSQLLTNLQIIDSYSFDLGFYIYTSSHNALTDEINKLPSNTNKLQVNDKLRSNTNTLQLNKNGMEYSTMVGGNMYMFDRLRMELNNEMTFELDRTLVSLLDLLKNSENQLETLAKILIYSKNPDDMLVHLPPSDSQLWSPINITADTMFNNVQELRGKILKLKNTFPLSDMDLHLMYTVLWKLLNQYTSCEFVEDQKNNTEMKIINLLQGIGLINDMFQFGNYKMTHFDKITGIESKSFTNGENILRYNFMNSSSQNNEINLDGIGENLYIRPVSSPHLINRSDTNLSRNSGCSHLYLDLFNNNINRSDLTVNTTDAIVNGDLDENVLYESNNINTLENIRSNGLNTFENINTTNNLNTFENNRSNDLNTVLNRLNNESSKGLEANLGTNSGGNWNGRDLGSDYIFHSLSLILLADRIRYFEVISDVFRNVIPIISTILNQPLIQYRPINSLISKGFEDYYGIKQGENEYIYKDSFINIQNDIEGKRNVYEDWNMSCLSNNSMNKSFSVCMGPIMPIHFTDYLKNKPLVKRNVLNEMYEKIFTLGSLSVDRPYFSVRVDRGIAHTTKLLRNSLWFQSTAQILNCNPNILRAKNNQRPFMVVFKGEGSTDFGGPFQELLTCISNEFMFPLTPDNDSQSATIKCQNTINNYGMHQDTVLIKFSHYPVNNLFTQNSTLNDEKGLNKDQTERVDKGNSIFTLGCCDLGVCCSSGCCCVLSTFPFDEPVGSKDIGSSCRCGASELYSDSCTQSVPMELSMYESLGRLCAMCLCMMNPLNIAINPIIWKKLLCSNLKLIDLLDCDKMSVDLLQRFASLESSGAVTEGDVNGLVFSIESAEGNTLDLVENGSNLPVSPSNLAKYLTLATLFRLTEGDLGCSFLAKGMNSVVPIGRLRTLLDPRSLEFVVCGDSLVDLAVLRAHTVSYSLNLKKDLFDVLSRFTNEMLQLFLRFVSGRSRLPHPNSDWCLRLEYDNKPDEDADKRLPTSATCSFRLLMPKYSSLDIMYKRLIYAIENCIAIDLDAHVVHDEMQLSIN